MVFKKIIFQNRYVALETPSRPPPFMANAILNFHFDFLTPSLIQAMKYIEKSRSGDKQFVRSLWNWLRWKAFFAAPYPTISWAMMDHLPTISGYAATLVIPWREFWSENTIGVDKLGIFWPKFGPHQRLEMTIFSSPSPDITRRLVRLAIWRWCKWKVL